MTPVAVLLASWAMAIETPDLKVLGNISFIVFGVILASYGEMEFHTVGFIFQVLGVISEATRLVMVQRLLSAPEYKMDPLVSLYHFAPVCAVMNFLMFLYFELPDFKGEDILRVGPFILVANAGIAFALNVSVVFLVCDDQPVINHPKLTWQQIGKTSSLVLTLSGILKDIILVATSIMMWNTPVTSLQTCGYTIALGGLLAYKTGADNIKEIIVAVPCSRIRLETMKKTVLAVIIVLAIFFTAMRIYTQYPSHNFINAVSATDARS